MKSAVDPHASTATVLLVQRPGFAFDLDQHNEPDSQAGDVEAKKLFDVLHRVSVIVNLAQMIAVLVVLVRYSAS